MPAKILVVDDNPVVAESCRKIFARDGHEVRVALSASDALARFDQEPFDVVFTDLKMVDASGIDVLRAIKTRAPDVEVVIITGYASIASSVEAIKLGAFDYVPKPFTPEELRGVLAKAIERRRARAPAAPEDPALEGIIARSEKMRKILDLVGRVAPTKATVLILGESGTGKELVARAIHRLSPRRDAPFIPVDSAALPRELLASTLFGHERGAFTGAVDARKGLFAAADGGTLFLDEIGNVDLDIQVKLLRVIQEAEFLPLGGNEPVRANVRLVFATNRDLRAAVEEGSFREDLYYRLDVFPIHIPPLRDRPEDILPVAYHVLRRRAEALGGTACEIAPLVAEALLRCPWPGNVRQLENAIEKMVILAGGTRLETLPPDLAPWAESGAIPVPRRAEELKTAKARLRRAATDDLERAFVLEALERSAWNISAAARAVGMRRQNFQALMRRHGIRAPRRS
ncbi:MAG: sigma-54-dependent Fis family transcriptional regulator [Planctomycetes bacterium]|nr:sigma-54-dependent Fis family transcriptional regulator [Planctomycetota bacterium]